MYQGLRNFFFLGKFGMLCFFEIPIFRFSLLSYYRQVTQKISVTLLGIKKDNKLNFQKYVTVPFQKVNACQLNALSWIYKRIKFLKIKAFLDSFIVSDSNYCPFVCYFCSAVLSQKKEKVQERTLRLLSSGN